MSAERQGALGDMLDKAFAMPAIRTLSPEESLRRVHFDWMEAGERTQRTVALLSSQLRRFLDDQVWMENRRIMELLRSIEARALACRDDPPAGTITELAAAVADISMPMERPLYSPPLRVHLDSVAPETGDEELDTGPLFEQWAVDREVLRARIAAALDEQDQVRLSQLAAAHPYEHGLTELMAYLSLAGDSPNAAFSEAERERIDWTYPAGPRRAAELPVVVFTKENSDRAL